MTRTYVLTMPVSMGMPSNLARAAIDFQIVDKSGSLHSRLTPSIH